MIMVEISNRLRIEGLPHEDMADLIFAATFDNPAHHEAERRGRPTHNIPSNYELYHRSHSGGLELPRGLGALLWSKIRGKKYEITDNRPRLWLEIVELSVELRDYQRAAVEIMQRRDGVYQAPCGAGKTTMAIAAIAATGWRTMIIVHTKDLLEQWKNAVKQLIGIDAGVVGAGKNEPGEVTICMAQTLARWTEAEIRELSRGHGMAVIDECHHVPASTFMRTVQALDCYRRIGLSATPTRADGLTNMLFAVVGPLQYQIDQEQLIASGHLERPTVRQVKTGRKYDGMVACKLQCQRCKEHRCQDGLVLDFNRMLEEITGDQVRLEFVADLVRREHDAGHSVLVLAGRKQYCEDIRLATGIQESCTITSDVGKRLRSEYIGKVRDGEIRLMCATQLADEGLDIPRLSRVVLALPTKARSRTIQRIGRIMRPHPAKRGDPVLIDFCDDHWLLQHHWRSRLAAYREILGDPDITVQQ